MTVTALPIYKLTNIPEALRQVAHQIELGELKVERCVLVMEVDGDVTYRAFGAEPFSTALAVGMLFYAIQEVTK